MSISTNELLIALSIATVLGGSLAYLFWKQRRDAKRGMKTTIEADTQTQTAQNPGTRQLQLQAYERLILLTDRIALPNQWAA